MFKNTKYYKTSLEKISPIEAKYMYTKVTLGMKCFVPIGYFVSLSVLSARQCSPGLTVYCASSLLLSYQNSYNT